VKAAFFAALLVEPFNLRRERMIHLSGRTERQPNKPSPLGAIAYLKTLFT
jgi:hypothetical protein